MIRQPDLSFDVDAPACNSFAGTIPRILICFSYYDKKVCHTLVHHLKEKGIKNFIHRFDGENYQKVVDSKYSHRSTWAIANYRGDALTTGCKSPDDCNTKTEILDMTTMTWSDANDYPFTSK